MKSAFLLLSFNVFSFDIKLYFYSLMKLEDKLLLRKRYIIETINDQLKNISEIEYTRHRSPTNFAINLLAGLIVYTKQAKKPSLNLGDDASELPVLL